MNQKRKLKHEERHERKKQQFEQLLKLIRDKKDDPDGYWESGSQKSGQTTTGIDKNQQDS